MMRWSLLSTTFLFVPMYGRASGTYLKTPGYMLRKPPRRMFTTAYTARPATGFVLL